MDGNNHPGLKRDKGYIAFCGHGARIEFRNIRVKDLSSEFSSATIDLGCVVKDVECAAKFYTEVIGFREVPGFSVPGDWCADVGLTNGQKLDVRVFVLGHDERPTRLKLMQVPSADNKKSDNAFIHSQLGFSYLTIWVKDIDAAMARLKKAGIKSLGKGPVALPKGFPAHIQLAVVRDPDGNLIELVGPKQSDE
jgi:catechol 2,3-dioxygenase-like lactoylglutathione lyase family enzyme